MVVGGDGTEVRGGAEPRYPDIEVQLTGIDVNAFVIIGTVRRRLREAGVSREEIQQFCDEAMSGDYDYLLRTCMRWVAVT